MFEEYDNSFNNKQIDWRDKTMIDMDEIIADLFRKCYQIDEEIFDDELDISEIIVCKHENIEDDWSEGMHEFKSDFMLPSLVTLDERNRLLYSFILLEYI